MVQQQEVRTVASNFLIPEKEASLADLPFADCHSLPGTRRQKIPVGIPSLSSFDSRRNHRKRFSRKVWAKTLTYADLVDCKPSDAPQRMDCDDGKSVRCVGTKNETWRGVKRVHKIRTSGEGIHYRPVFMGGLGLGGQADQTPWLGSRKAYGTMTTIDHFAPILFAARIILYIFASEAHIT